MKHALLPNGVSLSYVDQGAGDTVVLLHGFCGSSAYWQYVIPALAEQYRVIAPDLRGHGVSSVPQEPYSIEEMADDIALLLAELDISKAALFGHSLGGYITLAFAEKHQNRLVGFSLIHSMAYPDSEEAKANRTKAAESIREHGMEPFIKTLVPKLFAPAHLETMEDKVRLAKEIGLKTPRLGAMNTLAAMRDRPDRNQVLENTLVPILLLAGSEDQIIPAEKTFSVDLPHITQQKLEGVGHMGMYESPDQLLAGMKAFLDKVYW